MGRNSGRKPASKPSEIDIESYSINSNPEYDKFTRKRVSVILPTCNRYNVAKENIENILKQEYPDFEILICDDSDIDYHKKNRDEFLAFVSSHAPRVKHLYCARFDHEGKKDYGIARARNYGVMNATGEFLVFLDDRMTPDKPDVLKKFADAVNRTEKVWFFGDKGAQKTSFVENFSAARRCEIVDAGMFCERIDKYGGMTRELHGRYARQGWEFRYLPECLARQVCKSGGWDKKDKEIPQMRALLERLFAR